MTDTFPILVECGCCGCWHRQDYCGDCRNDSERYAGPEEYAERHGLTETEARALGWQAISLEDREEEE